MSKLIALLLSMFTVLATSLPAAPPQYGDLLDTNYPIEAELSPGQNNRLNLRVEAHMSQPIDEISSYVTALRFASVLALGVNQGLIPAKTIPPVAPYTFVQVSVSPLDGASVTRQLALECIYQSILWMSTQGFVHAEFFLSFDNQERVKCEYRSSDPNAPVVVADPADANATQTLDAVGLGPSVDISYNPNGYNLANDEVFINAIGAMRKKSWQDRESHVFAFTNVGGKFDAYVEVKGVKDPATDPEFSMLGLITAMWHLPMWLLEKRRLADVSGIVSYDGVPRALVSIVKGHPPPPVDGATPNPA